MDQHIIDYNTFNNEQIEFYDEQQLILARHSEWLEEFMNELPYEMKTEL